MYTVTGPFGNDIDIPESVEEDLLNFTLDDLPGAAKCLDVNGYVVVRRVLDPMFCQRVRRAFDAEVRRSPTPILRQKNMRYERNSISEDGFVENPIFNIQDLRSGEFEQFRTAVLDLLTHPAVRSIASALLASDEIKLIESMFFEAPAGTWAHQDSYYQDSARELGKCVAGWFALEDIDAGAGRFWVSPGSHRLMPVVRNSGENRFSDHHDHYKDEVLEIAHGLQLTCKAPFLAAGDILFWNSLTLHGSLSASRRGVSRASLTAHYLRRDDSMLQFHSRVRSQELTDYHGLPVAVLHDQAKWSNQLVREFGYRFPDLYMAARKLALKAVLSHSTASRSSLLHPRLEHLRQEGAHIGQGGLGGLAGVAGGDAPVGGE